MYATSTTIYCGQCMPKNTSKPKGSPNRNRKRNRSKATLAQRKRRKLENVGKQHYCTQSFEEGANALSQTDTSTIPQQCHISSTAENPSTNTYFYMKLENSYTEKDPLVLPEAVCSTSLPSFNLDLPPPSLLNGVQIKREPGMQDLKMTRANSLGNTATSASHVPQRVSYSYREKYPLVLPEVVCSTILPSFNLDLPPPSLLNGVQDLQMIRADCLENTAISASHVSPKVSSSIMESGSLGFPGVAYKKNIPSSPLNLTPRLSYGSQINKEPIPRSNITDNPLKSLAALGIERYFQITGKNSQNTTSNASTKPLKDYSKTVTNTVPSNCVGEKTCNQAIQTDLMLTGDLLKEVIHLRSENTHLKGLVNKMKKHMLDLCEV